MDSKRIERVVERSEIVDTIITFSRAVDTQDWDRCRAVVADSVIDDHGTPVTLSREAAIEQWRVQVSAVDVLQHVNTNFGVVVDGDTAKATCEFLVTIVAKGVPSGDMCTLGGTCDYDLKRADAGWRITGFKAIIKWSTGNANIIAEAVARASKP